jgi:hypothetical protein
MQECERTAESYFFFWFIDFQTEERILTVMLLLLVLHLFILTPAGFLGHVLHVFSGFFYALRCWPGSLQE